MQAFEDPEDVLGLALVNADAIVRHAEHTMSVRLCRGDLDARRLTTAKLDQRVLQKVLEDLHEQAGAGRNIGQWTAIDDRACLLDPGL